MHIVTTETGHPARVHQALHEVIALHAVLVAGRVGEMGKRRLAERVLFEFPEVPERAPLVETNGPVRVLPGDRVLHGLSLRVTLNTGVVRVYVVQTRRVDDRSGPRLAHVLAARPMTTLAADVPLRHRLGLYVVVDGMAAVTQRARRPLHVVRGIEPDPPVRIRLHHVRAPHTMGDVPLSR